MPMSIRADSTEYVTGTITTDHAITGDIHLATPVKAVAPEVGDWKLTTKIGTSTETTPGSGQWVTTYRVLMGPAAGLFSLVAGSYDWILRVTDTPEVPVVKVTTITVV